jgi:nucleoside-diphosphate-sugar epimerase
MRVAITGASGNVGSALVRLLHDRPDVEEIVGICRRPPQHTDRGELVRWVAADVVTDDLTPHLRGMDAVVHLAWAIQPSHRPDVLHRVNVVGSRRVFTAAVEAQVPVLVHASSVGVYAAGPKDRLVDETWPVDGIPTSSYSRDKAHVEALLDAVEAEHPEVRVVRLRPALIFQRSAASEITRYFLGRFVPARLLRPDLLPLLPLPEGFAVQAVHVDDVAASYYAAIANDDARGAFNVAADPVLDGVRLGALFGARVVDVPVGGVRALVETTWRLRIQPTDPGWLDLAIGCPLLRVDRAASVLGWRATRSATDALAELLDGMRGHAGDATAALAALPALPLRLVGIDRR